MANSSSDPTSKLRMLEVTAKQVVDRISAGGEAEQLRSEEANGLYHDQGDAPDAEGNTSDEEASSQPPSVEDQMVKELYIQLQKWITDVERHASGRQQSVTGGMLMSKTVNEDMHYIYSIESYLRSLDWSSQKVLSHKFSSQLSSWFKHLFHFTLKLFKESAEVEDEYNSIHPHWSIFDGVINIIQLILQMNCPKLLQTGYQNCMENGTTPLIYCSDSVHGQQIVAKLGLPLSCLGVVDTKIPNWVGAFEQRILADGKNQLAPIIFILNIDVADLESACKVAEVYKIWVHIYGTNVLSYFVKRPESDQIARSLTIDLTKWIRVPASPYLTLYKKPGKIDPAKLELTGLSSLPSELLCFTPWFLTQVIGQVKLTEVVNETCLRAKFLLSTIRNFECLKVVPNWATLSNGEVVVSSIAFQYRPPNFKRKESLSESTNADFEQPTMQYVDTLNSWLYHIAQRDLKSYFPVEFVIVENFGWSVLVDIYKTKKLDSEDENAITKVLENHMSVLQATVTQKIEFCRLVKDCTELEWVDHESQWAGLGAVRYIPKFNRLSQSVSRNSVSSADVPVTPEPRTPHAEAPKPVFDMQENVNHLNAKIVDKLKSIDTAFSLGEASNGDWCVQFGMVTLETDVKELVRLVVVTGEEIEESSEFFDRMSELVKKGIEKATEELKRESEDAIWEEGILRRVPVVGTFMNWFSPPMKEAGVRGRALNLAKGQIESTTQVYKYHMQMESFSPEPSAKTLSRTQSNQSNN